MSDLLKDDDFIRLEKEYKFLSRFRSMHELNKLSYVIVDIETTGLEPTEKEIIEIGAIKTNGAAAIDIFTSLIKPEVEVPKEIERLTGISQDMVQDQPPAKEVLANFLEFIGDNILIAHNSDFDIPFLKFHIAKQLKKELLNKILCTLKISRSVLPGLKNYKLHTIAEHFKVEILNRHRAMGDCEITFNVWNKLIDVMEKKNISTLNQVEQIITTANSR